MSGNKQKFHWLEWVIFSTFITSGVGMAVADIDQDTINRQADTTYENDDTVPSVVLDTLVVTATRSQKLLRNTPIAMQVLDSQTLEDNHAHTLKQALALLPNVILTPLHGKTGYEVRMQGFSGDQVLVLIDGLPLTASTGSAVNLSQYLNTNVAQIEVIQGAASAQYGSSAMGGVINIITKPITKSQAHIATEFGTNGDQNPSDNWLDNNVSFVEGSVEGQLTQDGRLKAHLSASYLDDKGLSLEQEAWPRIKDASRQQHVSTKISYIPAIDEADRVNPTSILWLKASYYDEEDRGRFNYNVPPIDIAQQRSENINRKRVSIGGKTQFQLKNIPIPFTRFSTDTATSAATSNDDTTNTFYTNNEYRLSGDLLYEQYDSDSDTFAISATENVLTSERTTSLNMYLAQVQLDLPLIEYGEQKVHDVQLGAKWQQDELNQFKNNVSELIADDVDKDVIEIYVQDDWMMGDDVEIVTGLRYQDDSDFGDHFAPKIALKKNLYDSHDRMHTLRASIGHGYRVPNLKERYFVFDHSNLGYKVMGNPDLVPEESTSYQIGYETALTDSAALKVNVFYNDVENLIQTDNDNPDFIGTTAIYDYKNINEAKTYGSDISLDWQANAKAHLSLGYAYLQTEDKSSGSDLTHSPEHKVSASIDYKINKNLQFVQQVQYESKQLVNTSEQTYSPSWWQFDSRLNYRVSPKLNTYIAINNLTDEQRDPSDPDDQRLIDNRQWIVGASYHW